MSDEVKQIVEEGALLTRYDVFLLVIAVHKRIGVPPDSAKRRAGAWPSTVDVSVITEHGTIERYHLYEDLTLGAAHKRVI